MIHGRAEATGIVGHDALGFALAARHRAEWLSVIGTDGAFG
jgi:hypothetical protein